ncbi:ATP-binding cassette domain-containing protein, partial [Streptomyces sp. 2MCAF27]
MSESAVRDDVVLRAEHIDVAYEAYDGTRPTRAVRDVSFELRRGELLGIAGESGCGKSTLAYAVARCLQPPARLTAGSVTFHGRDGGESDLPALEGEALRAFRWNKLSIVFQSAMNALNPVTRIGRQFDDIFRAHRPGMPGPERQERARALLDMVGIDPARIRAYPHELSGGMRQRVVIAMALALEPEVVIMDEPTTALDVVVQ